MQARFLRGLHLKMIKILNLEIKPIQIVDLAVWVICSIAVMELFSFIFMGAVFSWLTMMERFPHLKDSILLVFKWMRYYLIIVASGLIYYIIRETIKIFKNKNGR